MTFARRRRFPRLEHQLEYGGPPGAVAIYALVDPGNMTVAYVGKTTDVEARRAQHFSTGQTSRAVHDWGDEMAANGTPALMVVIAKVGNLDWQAEERRWIGYYRARGDLLNADEGGRGQTSPRTFVDEHGRRGKVGWLKKRLAVGRVADPRHGPVRRLTANEIAELNASISYPKIRAGRPPRGRAGL